MTVFSSCEFPFLEQSDVEEQILEAVRSKEPFSLIRLGDGEAIVLAFDDDASLQDLAYLHGHWGTEGVTLGAIAEVRDGLRAALAGANIIGVRDDIVGVEAIPDLLALQTDEINAYVMKHFRLRSDEISNLSPTGARRIALLHDVLRHVDWSPEQRFCSAWIHWELLASGALYRMFAGIDEVGLVTARPEVEHMISRRFDVRAHTVLVPDKHVESPGSGHHVPARYRTIRPEFAFAPGTLVLVGAGIPGKVYCQWLKEQGCIALDVGAVFDAWVGKASRPRVLESRFSVRGGDSVPLDLQLRVPGVTSDRRLTPRWKATGGV